MIPLFTIWHLEIYLTLILFTSLYRKLWYEIIDGDHIVTICKRNKSKYLLNVSYNKVSKIIATHFFLASLNIAKLQLVHNSLAQVVSRPQNVSALPQIVRVSTGFQLRDDTILKMPPGMQKAFYKVPSYLLSKLCANKYLARPSTALVLSISYSGSS